MMKYFLFKILFFLTFITYSQQTFRVCEGVPSVYQYISSTGLPGTYYWYVNGVVQNSNTSTQLIDWSTYAVGAYSLSVEFETLDGCVSEPRVFTITILECNQPYIYAPNAFTPDGDNFNNIWIPVGYNWVEMHYTIYNRWGEIIFESFDGNIGWDGTYGVNRNILVKDGVYVYKLIVTDYDGSKHVWHGHVTVLK